MKINEKVWFFDHYDNLNTGIITKIDTLIHKGKPLEYATIKLDDGGSRDWLLDDLYTSEKACFQAKTDENRKMTDMYKSQMNSTEDIIMFCLNHTVSHAEEYTDFNARKAVFERCAELGIIIE